MEYIPVRVSDIIRQVNRDLYLPAIQRELVWKTDKIERLFDSIMADFPIGSFLFWKLEEKHKDEWPIYEYIREFDGESPHNPPAARNRRRRRPGHTPGNVVLNVVSNGARAVIAGDTIHHPLQFAHPSYLQ